LTNHKDEIYILVNIVSERALRPSNTKRLCMDEKSTEIEVNYQKNREVKERKIGK